MKHESQNPLTWQSPDLPASYTLVVEPTPEMPVGRPPRHVELALTAYGLDGLSAKLEMRRQIGEIVRRLEIAGFNLDCDIASDMQRLVRQ